MVAAIVTRGRVDAESALRFATLTHLSALCLIPAGAIADRPIASQPVDWTATAVVLPAVGILLGLSFAWHRWRAR